MIHYLGEGQLTWSQAETELGRFGTVCLVNSDGTKAEFRTDLDGRYAELKATVTAVNHDLGPRSIVMEERDARPVCEDDTFDLGRGIIFGHDYEQGMDRMSAIGVMPYPPRVHYWLDLGFLNDLRGHCIRLDAIELDGDEAPPHHHTIPLLPTAKKKEK